MEYQPTCAWNSTAMVKVTEQHMFEALVLDADCGRQKAHFKGTMPCSRESHQEGRDCEIIITQQVSHRNVVQLLCWGHAFLWRCSGGNE